MSGAATILRAPAAYTLEDLARFAENPLRQAGAERAVAFGSYARGDADGYSDLDLAVVLATDLPPLERSPLLPELLDALPLATDLLVYTPEEFERGMTSRLGVFDAIAEEGVAIYARSRD